MENRVVITGLGIWSSIGTSLGEVTESLREGRSGIGLDPERRELGYISALTGIVKRPELKGALDRRKRLCLPQQGEYAYMATAEAVLCEARFAPCGGLPAAGQHRGVDAEGAHAFRPL